MADNHDTRSSAIAPGSAQKRTDDPANRRNHDRFDVQIKSVVEQELGSKASDMLMSNLSLGGCFLRCKTPESPGGLVMVRFKLPDVDGRATVVKAVGRVAWLRHGENGGMGIQFVRVDEGDLNEVQRFLAGVDSPTDEDADSDLRAA